MKKRLGDYIQEYSVRNKSGEDIPVYSITNSQGFCRDYFSKEVASKDKTSYKIVPRGCFAYNPSRINVGSVDWQRDEERVIVSPLYNVFSVSPEIDQQYLYYYLKSSATSYRIKEVATGSVRDNLRLSMLYDFMIELPSLDVQRQIVSNLDLLASIIRQRNQQLTKLDELIKARFVEMFGDMLLNSLEWPEKPLEGLADIVSGITKGRKTTETGLIEVPYMAVSNVKSGYIDWTTIKTILATKQEIEQYRLMPDDILMTEGGDPDKVGRGAIIKNPLKYSIHQNHIFRVRLDKSELLPAYFAEYLQHQKAKRYFLGCAKQTTGIASINMRQLRALPVLIPPLPLQNQFAAFVAEVDKSKLFAELFAQSTCILAENRSK
ncbi:MAG: restriction endonuclease subunit S [Faecalibacterium prausnitzii]|nr:restriction endonuclease subunit S [Faecalibacterium prausnitzii]